MNKKKALFAGTFDPFTKGHLSIVIQAMTVFDQVIIAVGKNLNKCCLFTAEERVELINKSIQDFVYQIEKAPLSQHQFNPVEKSVAGKLLDSAKLKIITYDDLTVDVALKEGASAIIRGERMIGDHDAEMQLAQINQELLDIRNAAIVQMLIPCTKPELTFISSSNVKKLCAQGEYIAAMKYVMPSVHNKLMEHYLKQRMQKLLGSHFDANKWKELVKSYTYNRYYHTLSHIGYALNVLDMIKEPYFDKIPYVAIELAIFYHDYYCSGNTDDEKLSAKKAVADYGYLTDKKLLSDLILATAQDYKAPDHWPIRELANVMRDIDYAILYDKANYGWYSLGICLEASLIFDIEKYIEKRAEFLKKASDMTFLCHTPRLTKNFGDAQNNIRNEYAYWLNL